MCHLQVCVSECPTANEFGVRNNPVCIDGVDTTAFVNLTSSSNLLSSANNIRVSSLSLSLSHSHTHSLSLTHTHTQHNLSLSFCPLLSSPLSSVNHFHFSLLQLLLDHISQEKCAPYYITSTAGIYMQSL